MPAGRPGREGAQPLGVDRLAHRVFFDVNGELDDVGQGGAAGLEQAPHVVEGGPRLRGVIGGSWPVDGSLPAMPDEQRRLPTLAPSGIGALWARPETSSERGGRDMDMVRVSAKVVVRRRRRIPCRRAHRHLGEELRETGGAGRHMQKHHFGSEGFVARLNRLGVFRCSSSDVAVCALVWKSLTR